MEQKKLTKTEADALPVGGYLRRRSGVFAYKNTKGEIWYGIDYTDNDKRHRRLVSKNITAAKQALEDKRNENRMYERLGLPRPTAKPPLFDKFVRIYWDNHGRHKRSAERDRWALRPAAKFLGGKRLDRITTADVLAYREARMKRLSNGTVNRDVALLKKMFNLAIDMGYIHSNPARSKSLKPLKEPEVARVISVEEEAKIVRAAEPRIRPFIVVAVETGMRRGEILGLDWRDVDWRNHRVRVANRPDAPTKSGKERWVPMTLRARETFRELGPKPAGSIFGGSRDTIWRHWKRAAKGAGMEKLRLHDLRHTCCTRAVEAGVPMFVLQEWMGHSSLETTRKYYSVAENHLRDAADRMETYWDNVRKMAGDSGSAAITASEGAA
jgi:integrase